MNIKTHQDVINLVKTDEWMLKILEAVKSLELPDWWIWSWFIRNKVWDYLHWYKQKTLIETSDIDVVYYDIENLDEQIEKKFEEKLNQLVPWENWSVKNQARMHFMNNLPQYKSSLDAMANWPETVTSIWIKIDENNNIIFETAHWIDDLINLEIRPTPIFKSKPEMLEKYKKRVTDKNWNKYWPKLKFYEN